MLHVGGVHAAVMDVPPALLFDTEPVALTLAIAGSVDVQVSGTPVMVLLFESSTVAVTLKPAPFAPAKVVPPELSAKVIDCTGQVLKVRMGLVGPPPSEPLVLLIEADSAVIPGTFAVTSAWPFTTPLIPVSSLT